MSTLSPTAPDIQEAILNCVSALRRVTAYQLSPAINRRMLELGEQKEQLTTEEHAELLALVELTQARTNEKLDAELALTRLRTAFPELVRE